MPTLLAIVVHFLGRYGKSWAQVCLRWVIQKGAAFTTQTRSRAHFEEDIDVFDFELSATDMAALDRIGA